MCVDDQVGTLDMYSFNRRKAWLMRLKSTISAARDTNRSGVNSRNNAIGL